MTIETTSTTSRMRYDHTPAFQAYLACVTEAASIKDGSKAYIESLPADEREQVEQLLSEVTFTRRRYEGNLMYVWPMHPLFSAAPIDPWPAINYPKFVLMADLSIRAKAQELITGETTEQEAL